MIRTVLVQSYGFTLVPKKRSIQAQVILDKSQHMEKSASTDFLVNQGVSTMIDAYHAFAHNKAMGIDSDMIVTGAFHIAKTAQEKHVENLLLIRDQALAVQYTQNGEAHQQHNQPHVGRGERQ